MQKIANLTESVSYHSITLSSIVDKNILIWFCYFVTVKAWCHAIYSLALKHVGLQICVRWYWNSQLHTMWIMVRRFIAVFSARQHIAYLLKAATH